MIAKLIRAFYTWRRERRTRKALARIRADFQRQVDNELKRLTGVNKS